MKPSAMSRPQSKLNIAMIAAEAAPFVKVGGLGDVVGALPKALKKAGANPIVIIPAYRSIDKHKFRITPCASVPEFEVPLGLLTERARIFQGRIPDSPVDVYLVGSSRYFDRDGVYDDPTTKEGYTDNMQRFIFLMRSGIELLRRLGNPIDIIHCHDSHAALIPGMMKLNYRDDSLFAKAGTLLTIHNIAYQGLYPVESLAYAGIDPAQFYPASPFEYWGQVNFMKAGIELSDKINTVSQTYAMEIRTNHEFGMGLEGVLHNREEDLNGIINGIDYDEWDPGMDPLIPAQYSKRDFSGKAKCKTHVQQRFGLPINQDRTPIIGIVSRLADQKGFDLIAEAVDEIASLDLQLVILGTGQQKYHDLLGRVASKYPKKIGLRLSFDNQLAHQIEAGCDMFLMPSRFEPCGLNQLYSLRYGTVPIVRATGGLADTVIDADSGNGTGFCFSGYTPREMLAAIRRALAAYANPDQWNKLRIRAMSQDWSWERSAEEYMKLYRAIADSKSIAI